MFSLRYKLKCFSPPLRFREFQSKCSLPLYKGKGFPFQSLPQTPQFPTTLIQHYSSSFQHRATEYTLLLCKIYNIVQSNTTLINILFIGVVQ